MLVIQLTALGLAAAIAYIINRSEQRAWRVLVGSVAGFVAGLVVAGALALNFFFGDATGPEQSVRALSDSFLFALFGAVVGTYFGRSAAKQPEKDRSNVANSHNWILWTVVALVTVVLGALALNEKWTSQQHRNAAECYLAELPEVQNDVVAFATARNCIDIYPEGVRGVIQGSGRGTSMGFRSTQECTAKMAAKTRSIKAAEMIAYACRQLYDELKPSHSSIERFLDGQIDSPSRTAR